MRLQTARAAFQRLWLFNPVLLGAEFLRFAVPLYAKGIFIPGSFVILESHDQSPTRMNGAQKNGALWRGLAIIFNCASRIALLGGAALLASSAL